MEKRLPVRQGDVLLVPVNKLPAGAQLVAKGRVVVEYGEATGHHHAVLEGELYNVVDAATRVVQQYVNAPHVTGMEHEEHGTVTLLAGVWQRWYQVEDNGEEERRVAD